MPSGAMSSISSRVILSFAVGVNLGTQLPQVLVEVCR